MSRPRATLLACAAACLAAPATAGAATQTFSFTGGQQNFAVPAGVHQVTIEACGAEGGDGFVGGGPGANGGCTTATVDVTPGETLAVFVGGHGSAGVVGGGGDGGFNGGALGGTGLPGGGGGGGASDVRRGGSDLDDRVVVAGGGGGGGGGAGAGAGGAGGGTTAAPGDNSPAEGGGGGTQMSGGTAGGAGLDAGQPGGFGVGGSGGGTGGSSANGGGGGGAGGYYGGGGGFGVTAGLGTPGGGGGGSSFPAGATHQQGVRTGDGRVVITYTAVPTLTTQASADVSLGGQVTDTATLASGLSPTGEIVFRLYGPNDATCSGTPAFTDTVAVSGNGDYASAPFTPAVAGIYRWVASYSGDADNAATGNACDEPSERVSVGGPPEIDNFRLAPDDFFASGRRTPLKGGTAIRFTLSEAATVHFRVRRDPPRKNGGPPPKHSHRFTRELEAGKQSVPFTGTLDGRTFKPGPYLMYARAVDDEGLSSERQTAPFTILGG